MCLGELDGDVGGHVGGAAATLGGRPGVWMEELAAVVAAVGHAGAVEGGVRPVQLLLSVTLHEEVDGHHSCTLRDTQRCDRARKRKLAPNQTLLAPHLSARAATSLRALLKQQKTLKNIHHSPPLEAAQLKVTAVKFNLCKLKLLNQSSTLLKSVSWLLQTSSYEILTFCFIEIGAYGKNMKIFLCTYSVCVYIYIKKQRRCNTQISKTALKCRENRARLFPAMQI